MTQSGKRPKFLNLFRIHLPVNGVNSFAHRVSGALMFVLLPLLVYLFNLSLRDAEGFRAAIVLLDSQICKAIFTLLTWAFIHHLLAGIRFLLMDIDVGAESGAARNTAWLVNISAIVLFIYISYKIWL